MVQLSVNAARQDAWGGARHALTIACATFFMTTSPAIRAEAAIDPYLAPSVIHGVTEPRMDTRVGDQHRSAKRYRLLVVFARIVQASCPPLKPAQTATAMENSSVTCAWSIWLETLVWYRWRT